MASSDTSTFTSAPGFCPDCGDILPLLGLAGGVQCYTCHRQFGPEVFGKMEQNYTIHFNSVESFDTQKKKGEEEAEGPLVERRCPKLKPEFTSSVGDSVDADPRWEQDGGSSGEKWGMFCDPSVMEDDPPPQSSQPYDDRPAEGKNMWSPLESKRFISGIEGRFEYAEDRFKCLAQQLYQSRDMFLQARGTCKKEATNKIPLIQSGITVLHASAKHKRRSEKSKTRPNKQVETDRKLSSHDINNASSAVGSESMLTFCGTTNNKADACLPATGNHAQREATGGQWISCDTDSSESILHAGSMENTTDRYYKILGGPDTKQSSSDLYSDTDNDQHVKGQPMSIPSPKDIKQTRKVEREMDGNHNSSPVITSSSHNHDFSLAEEETDEGVTLPILNCNSNGNNNEGKSFQAKNTDEGAFTAITYRSRADWSITDEENNGNVDRSCQVEKSKHKEPSKVTTGKASQLSPYSKSSQQSTVSKKGKNAFDKNVENISRGVANHAQIKLSVHSQSKYNNENSNDVISRMSHTRRAPNLNYCEIDNVKKISKTSLHNTSKKTRMLYTRDEMGDVKEKSKSTFGIGTASKIGRVTSHNDETDVAIKRSKSSVAKTTEVAKMTARNDETVVTNKRSKSSFAKISKVAKVTGQNGGTVVTNKKSKSSVSYILKVAGIGSQNNVRGVTKKRSKLMFDTSISKLARIYPNYETNVTIKRSQSDFYDIRKVGRMTVQNYPRDIPIKRSKSIITSRSQKKCKYSSPYAQSTINKGDSISQMKQKPSDPYSQMSGHSKSTIAVYVKPKPTRSICTQVNKPNKRNRENTSKKTLQNSKVLRQYNLLCHPKKGSKSSIYSELHVKQTPSNSRPFGTTNNASISSIVSKHNTKRKHRKSKHCLKKLKTAIDQQSNIEQETVVNSQLRCSRMKAGESQNEPMGYKISDETIDTLVGGTTQPENCEKNVIHDNEMDDGQSHSKNINQSNIRHCVARKDTQQDHSTGIGSEQMIIKLKSTPLVRSCSRYASSFNINKPRGFQYKNTMFLFSGLQKHYLVPTISSQLKRVMKSPFTNRHRRIMPFVAAKSTMPSHNINVQIQDVISIIRTKPFKGDMSTMSSLLGQSQKSLNSTLNLPSTSSVRYRRQRNTKSVQQDPRHLVQGGMQLSNPGTQSSMSHRPQRPADVWTLQGNNEASIAVNENNDTCCCSQSQTKSNYQDVLNKYTKHSLNTATLPAEKSRHEESDAGNLSMCMGPEEVATVETDGMRGRRLLSEILEYIYQDYQWITENLKEKSFHQNATEEEMGSIRETVERNTAIVDETMKLMDEGKELQNKYRRLAHTVTQHAMFDSHTEVMPYLREPPLSSRLRNLMLNIRHFKEELTQR